MTLRSNKFELKRRAPDSEGDELFAMRKAIDAIEQIDLQSASTPEQVAAIKAEAAEDRETIKAAIDDHMQSLRTENHWRGMAQLDPVKAGLMLELLAARDDSEIEALMGDISARFTDAAQPGEIEEQDYTPGYIDPNLPAPAAMHRLTPAKHQEIEAETAAALSSRKPQPASHAQPLGELPPSKERWTNRYDNRGPVDWDEIAARGGTPDEQ